MLTFVNKKDPFDIKCSKNVGVGRFSRTKTFFVLQTDKLQVEVYYEVLCPDSRYFILHQLIPAWERVGDIIIS